MCLIVIAWRVHPDYPLVVLANRDEYHARPTAMANWWSDQPSLLAGRDLDAGGTWLGVTGDGRFAALTNYRDPARLRTGVPSRGHLIPQLLADSAPVQHSLEELARTSAQYNAFSLLISDGTQLAVYESVRGQGRELGPGIYALSNHLLDTPWPKVVLSNSRLADALQRAGRPLDDARLLALLRDRTPAPVEALPQTGISEQRERQFSSAFICAPDYGTRSSSIVTMQTGGHVRFRELSWDATGAPAGEVLYRFVVSG